MEELLGLSLSPPAPQFNVAPSQLAPVVRVVDGLRQLTDLKWGYYEAWWATLADKPNPKATPSTKKKKPRAFRPLSNARGETVFTNGLFKRGALNRRCLVIASGWYEWTDEDHGEVPHFFHKKDGDPLTFAGIWTKTSGNDGKVQENFAIITTDANKAAAVVHPRMPVIIDVQSRATWLDANSDAQPKLEKLLAPYKSKDLDIYPVSDYVNSPKNTARTCIQPISS